jgi:hypothetical protein
MTRHFVTLSAVAWLFVSAAGAEEAAAPIPVSPDNFVRAESDLFLGNIVRGEGALGQFSHHREFPPIDEQRIIRLNRDTLYSAAVFDLDAGPVTITLPDAGDRFLSLQVIDEDQYTPLVTYDAGPVTLTREEIGTRYVLAGIRILVNPADPADVAAVHALQDAVTVDQPGGPGSFEVPTWDKASQDKVRDALLTLATTLPDTRGAFGKRGEVDPVRRLVQAAAAWGGNPDEDALYLSVTPRENDGETVYRLTVGDVPVNGFWSISVYDAKGYYSKNDLDAYTLSNLTAGKDAEGNVEIQFGGCDGTLPNCLPITPGWNYLVRLYRPRAEILGGTWSFPEPTQ